MAHVNYDDCIGSRIGTAGCAHRQLVNHHRLRVLAEESLIDQRALGRAGRASEYRQEGGGNIHADILQVINPGMDNRQGTSSLPEFILERPCILQMVASESVSFEQASKAAFVNYLAAFTPSIRPHIHKVVCYFYDIGVMLHHNYRIAFIT